MLSLKSEKYSLIIPKNNKFINFSVMIKYLYISEELYTAREILLVETILDENRDGQSATMVKLVFVFLSSSFLRIPPNATAKCYNKGYHRFDKKI